MPTRCNLVTQEIILVLQNEELNSKTFGTLPLIWMHEELIQGALSGNARSSTFA